MVKMIFYIFMGRVPLTIFLVFRILFAHLNLEGGSIWDYFRLLTGKVVALFFFSESLSVFQHLFLPNRRLVG